MRRLPHLLLASLSFCLATHSARAQGAERDVMAVVRRLFEGMHAGDSSMVHSTFHPSLRMISAARRDGQLKVTIESSPDGFLKAVGTPHPKVWDERISNERVSIDGPMASVWTDYAFFAGDTFSHCGIDHFLLVKDDSGAWKIIELSDTRRTEGCKQAK